MGVFKKGKNWFIDYYVQGRRKRESIGPSKELAQLILKKRKVRIAENKFLDVRKQKKLHFRDMARLYLESYSKPNKRSWDRDELSIKHLSAFFGGKHLHEITALDIENYKVERRQKVSPATVNRELACLKHIFNKAIEWGKLDINPASKVKKFREPNQRVRYLEEEEIERLYEACSEHLRPIVAVALNTGMRKSEILNLKWADVNLRTRVITILNSKNDEKREVPINEDLARTLLRVPKNAKSPYVFCKEDGMPYLSVKTAFRAALRRAKIRNFRFHDLRHTFASHLVMRGVGLKTVQELLGHKTINMTLRYSHLSPDYKRAPVEKLSSWMDTYMDTKQDFEKVVENSNLPKSYQ
jgi:integrase